MTDEKMRAALETIANWGAHHPGQLQDYARQALASAPVDQDEDWLVRQLEQWPTRVDPAKTTNIEYLMKSAAKLLRTRSNEDSGVSDATKRMAKTLGAEFVRTPTDQPATGDGAEDVVERLMDEAYQSADCPAGGPYALSWEQAKYMVRAALTSTAVVPGMVDLQEALRVAAARFDNCARMIDEGFGVRGMRRLEQAEIARRYAEDARAMIAAVPTPEGE